MSIERIREEAAKADQLIRDLAKGESSEAEVTGEQEAVQPEVDEQQTDQGVVADAAIEDQNAPTDLERVLADSAKWEQRYRSLDGMIQSRDRQIEQLTQLLANMQNAPAPKEPEHKGSTKLVKKEDEEAFGADLIDLARRISREESGAYVSQLEARIAELTDQLQGVAQTAAVSVHDRFENQLTQAVPNWKQIDNDPKFLAWLQEVPTRYKVFAEAARAQDVAGAAYFYSEFAGKSAEAPRPTAKDKLEKQVAPGRPRATPTPARDPQDKKQWTRSEIAQFYTDGKKRFSQEEYAKLERDIFAAQKEGRVDFTR